ncbi:hepatitis A virus cellular receptor 1-like [Physella acuta]|uniref:hepatitis A virus cellular receptor 1-like n=1 Tax=Physella acuta TaxID=109671 RepID=UPI0027DE014E|nr:hepatitis A virus cellular receptor 1-like [Physella acuta]
MTMYGDEVGNFSTTCSGQLQTFYYIEQIAPTSTTAPETFSTTTQTATTSDFIYKLITDESKIPSYAMYLLPPTNSSNVEQTTDTSTDTTSSTEYTNTISDIRPTLTDIMNTTMYNSYHDTTSVNLSGTFTDFMSSSTASTILDTSTAFVIVPTSTNITTLASSTAVITTTPTALQTLYPYTTTSATTASDSNTTSTTFTTTPTPTTSFSMYLTTTPTPTTLTTPTATTLTTPSPTTLTTPSPTTLTTPITLTIPTTTTTTNTSTKQITIYTSSYTTSSSILATTILTTITFQTSSLSNYTTTATTTTVVNTDLKPTESNKTTTIIISVCVVGAVVIVVCIIVVILVLRCQKKRRDRSHIKSVVVTSADLTENKVIKNVSFNARSSHGLNTNHAVVTTPVVLATDENRSISQTEHHIGFLEDGYMAFTNEIENAKTSSDNIITIDQNDGNIMSSYYINSTVINQIPPISMESRHLDSNHSSRTEYERLGEERRDFQNPYQKLLPVEQEQQLVLSDQELSGHTFSQHAIGETTQTNVIATGADNSENIQGSNEVGVTSLAPHIAESGADIQRDSMGYTLPLITKHQYLV